MNYADHGPSRARERPFAQVNVFSPRPYLGNPVAVVLDGDGLDDEQMLRIAIWTNLSETTFIVRPTSEHADYGLRIFTPGGELPFAGHPTLGSAHAWLAHGGNPRDSETITQECGVGLVQVRKVADTLFFAAPPTSRSGGLDEAYLSTVVAAFGLNRGQVLDHQWVDNGPGWGVLRLGTAREVLDAQPDLSLIPDAMIGLIGAYPEGSDVAYELRTFAPAVGVAEDPVCGSMNASVAQWLVRTGEASAGYRVSQGKKVGRAGEIMVRVDDHGAVWVGGETQTLFYGTAIA